MQIIIPCKSLDRGKSRLAKCLVPSMRLQFCKELLVRTLRLAVQIVDPAQVLVVSPDAAARKIAESFRVGSLMDPGRHLNSALNVARRSLLARRPHLDVMIVPIDLPLASTSSLSALVRLTEDVVIAPDRRNSGTNVLLLRKAAFDRFVFSYGVDSCAAHVACARQNRLSVGIFESESLAFDIDEPENYLAWVMCHA